MQIITSGEWKKLFSFIGQTQARRNCSINFLKIDKKKKKRNNNPHHVKARENPFPQKGMVREWAGISYATSQE